VWWVVLRWIPSSLLWAKSLSSLHQLLSPKWPLVSASGFLYFATTEFDVFKIFPTPPFHHSLSTLFFILFFFSFVHYVLLLFFLSVTVLGFTCFPNTYTWHHTPLPPSPSLSHSFSFSGSLDLVTLHDNLILFSFFLSFLLPCGVLLATFMAWIVGEKHQEFCLVPITDRHVFSSFHLISLYCEIKGFSFAHWSTNETVKSISFSLGKKKKRNKAITRTQFLWHSVIN